LFARLAAYEAIPEAQARERISKLRFATQLPGRKISADDRSELDSLRARTTQRFIDKVFQADTTAAAQADRSSYEDADDLDYSRADPAEITLVWRSQKTRPVKRDGPRTSISSNWYRYWPVKMPDAAIAAALNRTRRFTGTEMAGRVQLSVHCAINAKLQSTVRGT
jgi:hypothetical protein